MAVIEADTAERPSTDQIGRSVTLRRRRRRMIAALVAVGAIVVAAVFWWARTPQAFPAYGNEVGSQRTLEPGTGVAVGMVMTARPPDADIDHAEAGVTPGSAPVATSVVVCVHRTSGSGIGAVGLDEMADYCAQVLPAAGHNLADFPSGASLVLTVVPLAPGPVTIRGVEVTYHQGLRRTTQTTGVRFRYRPPTR